MEKNELNKILEAIKPYLVHGDRAEIARKFKVKHDRVTKILDGENIGRKGLEILKALQDRAEENRKLFQS